ncbi:MAG: hypothetical protein JXM68_10005 [Sedimentisphaerales bacterium]|nr:hypothetical protein [Sedimentisphaerales bacterium]
MKNMKKSWPTIYVGLVLALSAFFAGAADPTVVPEGPKQTDHKKYDGYSIILSGNWQGQIEPCGCTEKQQGGIDRRTETINIIAPEPKSRLVLDAGPLIDKFDRQNQLKFDTFLRSMKVVGYDAVALTAGELKLLYEHTVDLEASLRPSIICSNMSQDKLSGFSGVRYLQRELDYGGKKQSVVVIGLSDGYDSPAGEEMELIEPVSAVKSIVSELGLGKGDEVLLICLTQGDQDELLASLKGVEAIDMLVCRGVGDEPVINDRTETAVVCDLGVLSKYVARFAVAAGVKPDIKQFRLDAVPVHSSFNLDKAVVALMDEYQMSMRVENLIAEKIDRLGLEAGNQFAGSASCGNGPECHGEIYEKWSQFKHAQAVPTLVAVNRDYDPECMECHTVGLRYESGYRSVQETPELAAVGCEMCHGPGMFHNEYPTEPYREIFTSCEDCHNDYHSPEFKEKREEYFEKIKHWEGEREYWD